jgi:hypothetical protein
MKKVVSSIALLVLVVAMAHGQGAKKTQSGTINGPRIEIQPESHDFGKVEQNLKLTKDFEVKNIGDEDLIITRISTSCGCTAALTSERVVKPGKTTNLKVTFETRRYKGPVQRSVSVASNDPRRIRTVKVKAFVEESANSQSN